MLLIRKLHRWLGLVLMLQVFIWIGSGLLLSLTDSREVSGYNTRFPPYETFPLANQFPVVAVSSLELPPAPIYQLQLKRLLSTLVYRVDSESGLQLFDAKSGESIAVSESLAADLAKDSYSGSGTLLRTDYLAEGSAELAPYRDAVWRSDFSDELHTRVYIAASDGSLLEHRNDSWELADFLLMLHFMDYGGSGGFNTVQIIAFGFCQLWLAIAGVLLIGQALRRLRKRT
jgi:Na+-transporting NADH:ubiquinone oxidoreductase subunit F